MSKAFVDCDQCGPVTVLLSGTQVRQLVGTQQSALVFVCPTCTCTSVRVIMPAVRELLLELGVLHVVMPHRSVDAWTDLPPLLPPFRNADRNGHFMLPAEIGIDTWAQRVAARH